MRKLLRYLVPIAVWVVAQTAGAACLPKTFSTQTSENGYFYIFDDPSAMSTSASIVGRFWTPGAYATTGEQECDDAHWLVDCPGCGGGSPGQPWYIHGTLGQMGCTSGCPYSEMIVTLEDRSADGQSAFFAASRIDETPLSDTAFDFSRLGRDWSFVRMPAPQILASTTGEVFTAWFAIGDPASGFYGLPGIPASGTITAFRVYTRTTPSPRDRTAWTFVGRYPYTGGTTMGQATLVCPSIGQPYLAAAIEFDSGQVVTDYLSTGVPVECDTYAPGAGAVRDGGPDGLFVDRDAHGDLKLTWGRSCSAGDTDYEVYEGTIGDWTSHRPQTCSTAGARTTAFAAPGFDAYYLVVPAEAPYEGSYGTTSGGVERPLGAAVCRSRIVNACPP